MILGVGCDCCEIERFRSVMSRMGQPLLDRLFTPLEIAYCQRHKDPSVHFAGRFAAKEALAKALGLGIGSALSWHDMEISNDSRGRPVVTWSPRIHKQWKQTTTHLSISHSRTIAIAYAVIEGN